MTVVCGISHKESNTLYVRYDWSIHIKYVVSPSISVNRACLCFRYLWTTNPFYLLIQHLSTISDMSFCVFICVSVHGYFHLFFVAHPPAIFFFFLHFSAVSQRTELHFKAIRRRETSTPLYNLTFAFICSLSTVVNNYLHLPAISVWLYAIYFYLVPCFKKLS
jgi:hypothetical protein